MPRKTSNSSLRYPSSGVNPAGAQASTGNPDALRSVATPTASEVKWSADSV
ncbi:hypothetical protein JK167_02830 [Levilactobacillus brevis]|uniref:Uncharacterized protein n=1 Tax=Levilactobacillus brevis TaxID=1580 RepID=A0AA41EMY7_LEVBR|nr:hypothetical protein [Levilactobacillus brevis]MBS0946381.1 hypothetical protein [Levilactobacillus brevis]MBS1009767.1 hypothetical protein [Levilactobacillus brevis]